MVFLGLLTEKRPEAKGNEYKKEGHQGGQSSTVHTLPLAVGGPAALLIEGLMWAALGRSVLWIL